MGLSPTAFKKFLPTPSARRATCSTPASRSPTTFLPTPSARRATALGRAINGEVLISTHALREEGDVADCATPSL